MNSRLFHLALILIAASTFAAAEGSSPSPAAEARCSGAAWARTDPEGLTPPRLRGLRGKPLERDERAADIDAWVEKRRGSNQPMRFAIGRGRVTSEGTFENIEVLCSEPAGMDVEYVRGMISHWRFVPARLNGERVDYDNMIVLLDLMKPEINTDTCQSEVRDTPWIMPSPPRSVMRVPPMYPPEADAAGIEGAVFAALDIGKDGAVTEVTVICASKRMFELPAVRSLKTWKYPVLTFNGKPVPDQVQYVTVYFLMHP